MKSQMEAPRSIKTCGLGRRRRRRERRRGRRRRRRRRKKMVSFKFVGERPVLVVIGGFYRVSPSFYSFFPLWRTFRSSYDLNGRGRGGGKGGGGRRQRFTGLKWTFWSGHFSAISWPFVSRFLEILWDSLGFLAIL